MSHQECLVLIAYLNFLTTLNGKCGNQIPRMANSQLKPHRTEKVGRSATHPRPKLTELLAQDSGYTEHCEAVKSGKLKPHRTEKVGRSATHPRPKLTELLSDTTEDNASNEWDTGPAIGNEIW